jgi:hypothetical protein
MIPLKNYRIFKLKNKSKLIKYKNFKNKFLKWKSIKNLRLKIVIVIKVTNIKFQNKIIKNQDKGYNIKNK